MTPRCLRLLLGCVAAAAGPGCIGVGGMGATSAAPGYVAQTNLYVRSSTGVGATNLTLAPSVVFQDGVGSLSYHAPTFADLPAHTEVRDVQGRACESGLQVPWGLLTQPTGWMWDGLNASVGWGDSGYQRALRDAANQVGPDAVLYDVRVDLQTINVLSIWRQACLVVTASAVTRLPDDADADADATAPVEASDGQSPIPAPAGTGTGGQSAGALAPPTEAAKPAEAFKTRAGEVLPANLQAPADAAIKPAQGPAAAQRGGSKVDGPAG